MATIALNRLFLESREGEISDPDVVVRFRRAADLLSWEDIFARRRVVILAEAGSGKTEEMEEQARLHTAAGQFAFFATVEDVDRDGLDGALTAADRARLVAWRLSDQDGWFLIDSIDEAKLGRVRFERAIRRIADGIVGAERRAHVVLSCRLTDWESTRDLERLKEGLPIPRDPELPVPPTPDEELRRTLRHDNRKEPERPVEQPLVVLMAPLDPERVRLFASAKGVPDLGAFLQQIEAANLWSFARRPLDLEWLVNFWRSRGRFGSLAEMLESSLAERVRETNLDRTRGDALDATRALHAVERIGAALVFERKGTIAIPDSELLRAEDERPLDLAPVLPDWSAQDRARLLSRPVFDPATFGRARLHNDNQGVVRGYLTARWLHRLGGGELSRGELFDLLFATTYGIGLVKPSMMETAAWLAIWEEDVGREIASRDPSLLLTAGDPASLSTIVREAVLTDVVERLAADGPRLRLLDHDSVKRFVQPDLGNVVRRLWSKHKDHTDARELLLRLIWLGQLKDCADLAETAAYGAYPDRHTQIVAGRALGAAGDVAMKRRYIEFVKANSGRLPNTVCLDAIDGLFPGLLSVGDLLEILANIDVTDADGSLSVEWQLPGWINRLETRPELEHVLHGLLAQLGPEPRDIGHIPDKREEGYFSGIATAAGRLLEHCRPDEAPVDAIDAALRLGLAHRYGRRHSMHEVRDVAAELRRTGARRRLAFWRAAEQRSAHRFLQGRLIEHPNQIELFGYPLGLRSEDIGWLLEDARACSAENERKLAINTAMRLWRDAESPADLLAKIEAVTRSDPVMQSTYELWLNPPPTPAEQLAQEREYEEVRQRHEEERAARDRSWVDFVNRLRKNPDELREIGPPTAEGVDARLHHLWLLLCETAGASSRYAVSSVTSLEPMLGREVAAAFQDALIKYWRQWRPKLKSARAASARNQMSSLDSMGITGISLEAATNPAWAEQLSSDEATLAATYATLELNGFPTWFAGLTVAKPAEVRDVLLGEISAEIDDPEPRNRYEVLEDISRANLEIAKVMAPVLYTELKKHNNLATPALGPVLEIITRGLHEGRQQFAAFAIKQFSAADDARIAGIYLGAAFRVDVDAATEVLTCRLEKLGEQAQTALVQEILPVLFGTGFRPEETGVPLSFPALERLVTIAFRTIRVEEDRRRPSGQVYSPDDRDHAEQARGAAFKQLLDTPGRATFVALQRLTKNPDCPINASRLQEFARERAAQDSESAAWLTGEVIGFEATGEAAPSTAKDLQRTALRRFDDMQHELLHGDFAQGTTVQALPDEPAVQNWIADRLRLKQGRAYSVEREPHVADEKEPDVRLRAKVTDASLAIEVKVAESWSLEELEAALTDQLCGRYLRARDARHGILLVVHQQPRPNGWKDPVRGGFLNFGQVIDRLRRLAQETASTSPDAPQPEIAVLDVSSCAKPKAAKVRRRSPAARRRRAAT